MPTRVGRKKRKGPNTAQKLPAVYPNARCRLKLLKLERIKDHLLLEEEFVQNQERLKPLGEDKNLEERSKVDELRGSPMQVGTLEEIIDDDHAIISSATGSDQYVSILSMYVCSHAPVFVATPVVVGHLGHAADAARLALSPQCRQGSPRTWLLCPVTP